MAKRSFLMLAHKYEPTKHNIKRWYVSEKLDGMRAYWDGGITRGIPAKDVPFANVEKDGRYVKEVISTGLWSRYGKTIQAPSWWLDLLPKKMLDGELFYAELVANTSSHCGELANDKDNGVVRQAVTPGLILRGNFQKLISATKQLTPRDIDWKHVEYRVFDMPTQHIIYGNGEINEVNFKKVFKDIEKGLGLQPNWDAVKSFSAVYDELKAIGGNNVFRIHTQTVLDSVADLQGLLDRVIERGGEGLMLRDGSSVWVPQRSHSLLKVKTSQDAEATVVDYVWGRETDKGSKLLGKMGAMIVRMDNGITFELSGFTDNEREMSIPIFGEPGERVASHIESKEFPRGSRVTFRFRELSRDGVPKEARFHRKWSV